MNHNKAVRARACMCVSVCASVYAHCACSCVRMHMCVCRRVCARIYTYKDASTKTQPGLRLNPSRCIPATSPYIPELASASLSSPSHQREDIQRLEHPRRISLPRDDGRQSRMTGQRRELLRERGEIREAPGDVIFFRVFICATLI